MLNVRPYTDADEQNWNEYVKYHPEGTLFHLTSWKDAIEGSFGHRHFYTVAEEKPVGGVPRLVGVFPLFRLRSILFGEHLVSVPFAEIGGPLADNPEVEQQLIEYGAELSLEQKCDYLELRTERALREDLPVKSLYANFSREIHAEVEENLKAIPRKSRAAVRQGIKNELKVEFGNHLLPEFYDLVATSFHNLGTPVFPRSFFLQMLDCHGDHAQIMVVRTRENKPIAAVLSFFYGKRLMPYYAGSNPEYRRLCPNDFMYWKLMEFGCENGFKIFDFGRSKEGTGSYDFKRHWGFEPKPLAYQYHLTQIDEMPNLSPANPKYQRKIEMWKRLPLFVTKLVGPRIARYLA